MKLKAFLILMVVTVVTVVIAAKVAERWFAPGFERGIVIAVIAALVVFPLSRWFEHLGWVKGAWSPGGAKGEHAVAPLEADQQLSRQQSPSDATTDSQSIPQHTSLARTEPSTDARAAPTDARDPRSPTGEAR